MWILSLSPCSSYCGIRDSNFQICSRQTTRSACAANTEVHLHHELKMDRGASIAVQCTKRATNRIREALLKVDLSVSPYDTAWVAMVPSSMFPQSPCFPECLDWIIDNQNPDGSWGLPHYNTSLIKDALSSTLACILALRRWGIGEGHVKHGLDFIGSNFSSAMDRKLLSPIGFNIIFPGMVNYAVEFGLDLPMHQTDIDTMRYMRDLEVNRGYGDNSEGRKAYLAYVAEGLCDLQNWQDVMKYQKKNGSLFNSPSTTAAAVIHIQNDKALNYLHSITHKFGGPVPAAYPLDLCKHLYIIDNLERIGIAQHFTHEIKNILDKIYRCWLLNDDELTSDIATHAMAFRILRLNGYDISSDALAQFGEANHFYDSLQGYTRDLNTVLELYRASQLKILPDEEALEKLNSWSSQFLKEELSTNGVAHLGLISQEVDYALRFPFYANLERLEHKRNIEHFNVESFRILKTIHLHGSLSNKDMVKVAIEDFDISQSIYLKELGYLESWIKENKLDQLEFARQKSSYCYLSAAATLFLPEMSDARLSWAKNGVLTTVVDDFFDIGGSREELANLISLVEKWDGNHENEFCSEQVEIVFSALYSTVNELGARASALQNRNVTDHIIEIWLSLMVSMMKEAEWLRNKSVPTMGEYLINGYVSFALGPIILPALYFVGPKLSEDVTRDPEYHNLFKLVSTCGRLLNDIQGFEREGKEGKLNSVSLRILHCCGSTSEDIAKSEIESVITSSRRELLRLVLQSEGSVVPRPCKELFWKMSRILHLFYWSTDGFTSPKEMMGAVKAVIHEPLKVNRLLLQSNT